MELLFKLMNDYNYRLISCNDNNIIYEDLELDEVISESVDKFINRFIESLEYEMHFFNEEEERKMFKQTIDALNKIKLDKEH